MVSMETSSHVGSDLHAIVVFDVKNVSKPYNNRRQRQFYIVEIVSDYSITRAARAVKIACDNRKQEWYRVNRPLVFRN